MKQTDTTNVNKKLQLIPISQKSILKCFIAAIFILSVLLILCSCGESDGRAKNAFNETKQGQTSSTVVNIDELIAGGGNNTLPSGDLPDSGEKSLIDTKVDIDLITMNPMLAYAEVWNILMEPHKYIGKTVKIRGRYYSFYDENISPDRYFFLFVEEYVSCCPEGMELTFDDSELKNYPNGFPSEESYIEIVGKFDMYELDGQNYVCVKTTEYAVVL